MNSATRRPVLSRRGLLAAASALTVGAVLAACGGSSSVSGGASGSPSTTAASQADIDKAMTTPTQVTFWTWVPNIDKEIALLRPATGPR